MSANVIALYEQDYRWDLGLLDMCVQERRYDTWPWPRGWRDQSFPLCAAPFADEDHRTLTVPPRLGYGDKPYYDIPANSVLGQCFCLALGPIRQALANCRNLWLSLRNGTRGHRRQHV